VFDQDDAIDTLVDAIKLSRAGLRDAENPSGVICFLAPRALGKPKSRGNCPKPWAWNWRGLTCPNIWNAMRVAFDRRAARLCGV
jgi:hypothetical protein